MLRPRRICVGHVHRYRRGSHAAIEPAGMLFSSLSFAVFFPTVVILYYALKECWKVPLLLLASCIFYMCSCRSTRSSSSRSSRSTSFLAPVIAASQGRRHLASLWISAAAKLGMLASSILELLHHQCRRVRERPSLKLRACAPCDRAFLRPFARTPLVFCSFD